MRSVIFTFNGLVLTLLVRSGEDTRLPKDKDGNDQHTFNNVYTEMFLQISRDYPGLPDGRTLKAHEIKFYFEGVRAENKQHTKPKG